MKVQNQQLFTSAIRDHSPSLLKIAAAFEHDEASQQELHQSIVLAIWQSLIHFENQCDLCIYVFRVAFNCAFNHVVNKTDEQVKYSPVDHDLMTLIRRLSLQHRQLVCLQLDGFGDDDIAQITGVGVKGVAGELYKARQELQAQIKQTVSSNQSVEQQWDWVTTKVNDTPDCQLLIQSIQKQRLTRRLEVTASGIVGLLVPGYILIQMIGGLASQIDYVAMGFVLLLSLVIAFGGLLMRHSSYERMGESNQGFLKLLCEEADYNIRLLSMGKTLCVVIIVLFGSLFLAMFGMSFVTGMALNHPDLATAIMVLIILCFPALYFYQKRIHHKIALEKLQLEAMLF